MSIIDALRVEPTHFRRPYSAKAAISISLEKSGKLEQQGFAEAEEYVLFAKAYVSFWAVPAQLHRAREVAEKNLLCQLHSGVLAKVAEIRSLASGGDCEGVLIACSELQKELGL